MDKKQTMAKAIGGSLGGIESPLLQESPKPVERAPGKWTALVMQTDVLRARCEDLLSLARSVQETVIGLPSCNEKDIAAPAKCGATGEDTVYAKLWHAVIDAQCHVETVETILRQLGDTEW